MPVSEETEPHQGLEGKRRRNSSGRKGAGLKRHQSTTKAHQRAAPTKGTREGQRAGQFKWVKKLKFGKYSLSEDGINEGILLESLIAECFLNNPEIEIFEDSTDIINVLLFSNPKGDVFTLLNIMRTWSNKPGTTEATAWCRENHIKLNTCRAVENYVEERFEQIQSINPQASGLHFAVNVKQMEEILYKMVVSEIEENICICKGHPSLGYMSLQSYKRVSLSEFSVAHYHKDYPAKILTLADTFELQSNTFCMVINEERAKDIYDRLSLGYDLQYTVAQNCVSPVTLTDNGEEVIRQMRTSWWTQAKTLPSSLKSFVEEMCPQSAVIFEDKGSDIRVYAPLAHHDDVLACLNKELASLQASLQNQVAEICYPTKKSSLAVTLAPGGSVKDVLYPDEFRCVAIVQTEETTLEREEVVSELEKLGKIASVMQYFGDKLTQGKWGKVAFENPADVEKVMQAKLSGSFLVEFGVDNDIEEFSQPEQGITMDQSECVTVKICRRICESGNVKVEIKGRRTLGKIINSTIRINKTLATIKAHSADCVMLHGCHQLVTEEEITKAFMDVHGIAPSDIQIERVPTYKTNKTEVEFFLHFLTRIIDKVTDINKVNIKVTRPQPEDIFILAQLKFKSSRNAKSAVLGITEEKIRGVPLQVIDYSEDTFSLRMYVPHDIHSVLRNNIEAAVKKATKSKDITITTETSETSVLYNISAKNIAALVGIEEVLHLATSPTLYGLSQQRFQQFSSTQGCLFNKYLSTVTPCCLRLDRRAQLISIYAEKSTTEEVKRHLNTFFKQTNNQKFRYRNFDFSHKDAKDNAMFELAKDVSILKDIEVLPIKSSCTDLFVRGPTQAVEAVYNKYFAEITTDCCSCFCPLSITEDSYILQGCRHPYCLECVRGLIEVGLQDKNFPIKCMACSLPVCLWDLFIIANGLKEDPRTIAGKAIDLFMGTKVNEWGYCHNIKCKGILRKRKDEPFTVCPTCFARQCSKCNTAFHRGSCEDHLNHLAFDEWMKSSEDRKSCKNCNMAIEKISGCNRVHCSFCRREICWVCLEHFPDATSCYNHLNDVHGGY